MRGGCVHAHMISATILAGEVTATEDGAGTSGGDHAPLLVLEIAVPKTKGSSPAHCKQPPTVSPFEECPRCGSPVIQVRHPYSAKVECFSMRCGPALAVWSYGMARWKISYRYPRIADEEGTSGESDGAD